jgi:hypothetical protein
MSNNLKPIEILPGDRICLTKIVGRHQHILKQGEQHQGILGSDGIKEGKGIKLTDSTTTSFILDIFTSYTVMIVWTENSMYLVEKLEEE